MIYHVSTSICMLYNVYVGHVWMCLSLEKKKHVFFEVLGRHLVEAPEDLNWAQLCPVDESNRSSMVNLAKFPWRILTYRPIFLAMTTILFNIVYPPL